MKRGAIELSIGTIVVVVLAMTMLILGVVFVRSIMCGAIGLTGDLNQKVRGEVNKLFGASGGEIVCIGSGEEPVSLIPGKVNTVWCSVKASETANYEFELSKISGSVSSETKLKSWIVGEENLSVEIAPGDDLPKKFIRLSIPNEAPAESVMITVKISKDNELISTQQLDFETKRVGWFSNTVC